MVIQMKKSLCLCLAMVLCCVLCLSVLPGAAYAVSTADAKEPISLTTDASLTLQYRAGNVTFPDIAVQLYRIASVSADFRYTLCDEFLDTALTLNGISAVAEWNAIRTTLESYITSRAIVPLDVRYTDATGMATFDSLSPGLYFVMPVYATANGVRARFASVLTALPGLNPDGTWNYDVTVYPKPDVIPDSPDQPVNPDQPQNPDDDDHEYTVVKLWRDADNDRQRPNSIRVDLYCGDEWVRTVELSAENHWSYTWTSESDEFWTVAEADVPDGYRVTVEVHGNVFTIVNTITDGGEESPPTGETWNLYRWAILLGISGMLMILLAAGGKRKTQ